MPNKICADVAHAFQDAAEYPNLPAWFADGGKRPSIVGDTNHKLIVGMRTFGGKLPLPRMVVVTNGGMHRTQHFHCVPDGVTLYVFRCPLVVDKNTQFSTKPLPGLTWVWELPRNGVASAGSDPAEECDLLEIHLLPRLAPQKGKDTQQSQTDHKDSQPSKDVKIEPEKADILRIIEDAGSVGDLQRAWDSMKGERVVDPECFEAAAKRSGPAVWQWLCERASPQFEDIHKALCAALDNANTCTFLDVVQTMQRDFRGRPLSDSLGLRILLHSNTQLRKWAKPLIDQTYPQFSTTGHVCVGNPHGARCSTSEEGVCVTLDVVNVERFFHVPL